MQLLGKLLHFSVPAVVAHALDHRFGRLPMLAGFLPVALRDLKPSRSQTVLPALYLVRYNDDNHEGRRN
jgi:hypothetical protein